MWRPVVDPALEPIHEKIGIGERLGFEDGVTLYRSPDLLGVGHLANIVRERLHGRKAYFIRNQHINYTNICVNGCRFCAFGRKKGGPGAYQMSLDEIFSKVRGLLDNYISELHIVGGLNPELPYQYYIDMLRGIHEIRPDVHIQAFTVVEVAFIAEQSGRTVAQTLTELKEAGLGSIPGGGAEVFSSRIRRELCEKKLPPEGYLGVAKTAHRLGIRTNATMLYGHIETVEERVDHLIRLREAQDETGGFLTFIPLAFHPANTELAHLRGTTGYDDLKNIAVARLMLDNFDHIKSFWIMVTPKISQLSLLFGADDIDGTVTEERITHAAGAQTAEALTRRELVRMIEETGREPVERDTVYVPVTVDN